LALLLARNAKNFCRYRFAAFETIDISPKWPYTVTMTTATKIEDKYHVHNDEVYTRRHVHRF